MNTNEFWFNIGKIIRDGFDDNGIQMLDHYVELFRNGKLQFDRFLPKEQHGCSEGGSSHVAATFIAAAENRADSKDAEFEDFKTELKSAKKQAESIEKWSRRVGVWIDEVDSVLTNSFGPFISEGGEAKVYDNGVSIVKAIGLDYYIQPVLALDRISLHNAYFPETKLSVIGFGRDKQNEFKIVVEQPFIEGNPLSEQEIQNFIEKLGFKLRNPINWTYSTPEIYLSDMHDENLIQSANGNIFVIDCDIRINVPSLRQCGTRRYKSRVSIKD